MEPEHRDEEVVGEQTGSSAAMPSMGAPSEKEKAEDFVPHFCLELGATMVFSRVIPYKGVQKGPCGSKCLLSVVKKLGYPKMVTRSYPEPALHAVVESAKTFFRVT